jgi:holliday junction DNA helicase RuvA
MIAYLKGNLINVFEDNIVLEVNSIGYNLKIASSIIPYLPSIGEEVKMHTYLYVKEDAINLFGFLSKDDLDFFKKLITVNGIGPKGALSIQSTMTTDALRYAIISSDAKAIAKAPGIGIKTAERLIIDLKDKISPDVQLHRNESIPYNANIENNDKQEAIEALVALGYSLQEAVRAVKLVDITEKDSTETILKQALRNLI